MNTYPYEKIAKILRTDKDNIRLVEEKLNILTGKKNVMAKILEENQTAIETKMGLLGLGKNSSAKEIYAGLVGKIEKDDEAVYNFLGKPSPTNPDDWNRVLQKIKEIIKPPKGLFLKKEKALEFLKNCPPQKVIRSLGYRNVDELIANENFYEIFSSLRFVEGAAWLNSNFLPQYSSLKPSDFEERDIATIAISQKWAALAQEFIQKKHHNISHLKEIGLIYIIPVSLDISGETLRNFSLLLHYHNEVPFYSNMFRHYAKDEKNFSQNLISLLRGDVMDEKPEESDKSQWLVIQRYLSKEDENDWRLFVPHVNPEALHWEKAERMLFLISRELKGFATDLSFWHDLNWVGDYFKTDSGIDVLVSFNIVDAAMDLVKRKEMTKYLYHHQESLWNKIFIEYFGEEKMEEVIKENIIKGYFEL